MISCLVFSTLSELMYVTQSMLLRKQVKVMWLQETSRVDSYTDELQFPHWAHRLVLAKPDGVPTAGVTQHTSAPDTSPALVVKPLFLISSAKALDRHIPSWAHREGACAQSGDNAHPLARLLHVVPGTEMPFQYCPRSASSHGVCR